MSTTPARGRADYLELGSWNVACAECGRKRKDSDMRQLPPGVPGGGMWVCFPEHWNPRQPQDYVRGVPDKMAAPYVQQQVDFAPLEVQNVDSDTTEVEIEIDTAASPAGAEPIIVNVFAGVTLGTLTITDVSGGIAAPGIILNNWGVVEEISNPDDVDLTIQGTGLVVLTGPLSLVAGTIPPSSTEDFHGYTSTVGSLTPNTYNSQTITTLFSGVNRFGVDQSVITFNATGLTQGFFTTLTINSVTLASIDASFTDNGSTCTWSWLGAGNAFFYIDGTYTVDFT